MNDSTHRPTAAEVAIDAPVPTPRTDSLLDRLDKRKASDAEGSMLLIAHAQQLEEELAEARRARDQARKRALAAEAALREIGAVLDTIHDRHADNADCDEDASGHRTANRDMNTMVDCEVAKYTINRALEGK
jgi:hypothetical protein